MNIEKYIPLDKSWMIRLGILDLLNNQDDMSSFLRKEEYLGDDLTALQRVLGSWDSKVIHVGESGTLLRFSQFISWKFTLGKIFIKEKTLEARSICDDSMIVNLGQEELLKLDNGTSQWASAAVLCGDTERLKNPPYKLQCTYDAIAHWQKVKKENRQWEAKKDKTIRGQAKAFLEVLENKKFKFIPKQAEDYCFVRAFDVIDSSEGEKRWPSLRTHESDRILEMERALSEFRGDREITSADHRVIQAIVMRAIFEKKNIEIKHRNAVSKSWPLFWDFIHMIERI